MARVRAGRGDLRERLFRHETGRSAHATIDGHARAGR
jgi:hypothetical protein